MPLFDDSKAANDLALAYVAAAIFCKILPLCAGSIRDQSLELNAAREASTHRFTSAIVALGTVAITSPDAGLSTSAVAPSSELHHSPAIDICSSAIS